MPKRICLLNNSKEIGGVEHHLVTLCQLLSKSDVELYVVCRPELYEFFDSNLKEYNIEIKSIEMGYFYHRKGTLELIRWIRQKNIHIIHSHLYPATRFAAIPAFICGIKIIETVHIEERWRKGVKKLFRLPDIIIDKLLVKKFICVSKAVQNDCIYNKHINPKKTSIIYNCSRIEGEFNGPKNQITRIGFLGRLEAQKRVDILIKSFAKIESIFPNVQLKIAGQGSLEAPLKELSRELVPSTKIQWLGYCEPSKFLKQIDLLVLPSDFEGFALSLLEAGKFNLPVIATNVSGNSEIISNKKTGLLFPSGSVPHLAEQLKFSILNPKIVTQLGNNLNYTVSTKFSSFQFKANTLKCYQGA